MCSVQSNIHLLQVFVPPFLPWLVARFQDSQLVDQLPALPKSQLELAQVALANHAKPLWLLAARSVETLSGMKSHCKAVPAWASVTLSVSSARAGTPAGPARHSAAPEGGNYKDPETTKFSYAQLKAHDPAIEADVDPVRRRPVIIKAT